MIPSVFFFQNYAVDNDLPAIIVNFPFASTCYTNGPFLYVVFLTVTNLYPFNVFLCLFFYIPDVSFVCLHVHHMLLSCGIKSILTYLLAYCVVAAILEASMSTLQEGQLLLERIREMGVHADVQNRHATTAACYGIEHLLELLQDRRRHLEELWLQRRIRLEQCLQLLLLDQEVGKVRPVMTQTRVSVFVRDFDKTKTNVY